jgi:hypothetical protein
MQSESPAMNTVGDFNFNLSIVITWKRLFGMCACYILNPQLTCVAYSL